jgi:Fe-S cluster assembly protein SufD
MEARAIVAETELYAESFAAFEEARPARQPPWLQKLRRDAFSRFQELGFPTSKVEAWKYTNVAPIARTVFRLVTEECAPALPAAAGSGPRFVFVNGRFRRELSRLPQSGSVGVSSLREALASRPEALEQQLARYAEFRSQAFTAWNTAFFEDGAFIEVPRGGVLAEPIELLFLSAPGAEPTVSHPRNLIVAGSGSHVTIVERYAGDAGTYLTNSVTELLVGDGAVVEHYKVQREDASAFHVQTLQVHQDRASSFTSHNLAIGAALARTDLNVVFSAEGSECALNGLFLGAGTQHIDNHTLIDHARPHCGSRELYKGILDGKSRGVFHGTIIVRPDAQKTDAMQTNKNLLLSKEALVDSTPVLEIFADDVKCKHASTIGQLDANSLFYLRSRGIGEEDARAILTYAFAADVANRIRLPGIRAEIESLLGLRLVGPREVRP